LAALAADASLVDLRRRIDALKLDQFQDRVARLAGVGRGPRRRGRAAYPRRSSAGHGVSLSRPRIAELRREPLEAERNLRKAVELTRPARKRSPVSATCSERGTRQSHLGAGARMPSAVRRLKQRSTGFVNGPDERPASPGAGDSAVAAGMRGDVAALIIRLRTVLARARGPRQWPRTCAATGLAVIVEVIRAGDGHLRQPHLSPKALVRRSDLAQAVHRVLTLTVTDPSRADRNRVTMADVAVSHLAYEDISAAVAAGVLSLDGANFRPSRPVTGQEAVDTVRRLERITARPRGGSW
jgi:hypothetical protein